MKEYAEGICEDGGCILKDGVPITISEIIGLLNDYQNTSHNSNYTKSPEGICVHEKEIQEYVKDRGHDYCPFCGGDFA